MKNRRLTVPAALVAGALTITTLITALGAATGVAASTQHPRHTVATTPASAGTLSDLITNVTLPPQPTDQPIVAAQTARTVQTMHARSVTKYLSTLAFLEAVKAAQTAAGAQAAVAIAPVAPVVSSAPTPPSVAASGPFGLTGFLACVAYRESHDDPTAVNPSSGAGGLFQFLPSTWANLGEPGLPQNASVAEQISAAQRLMAMEGTSPWAGGGYSC